MYVKPDNFKSLVGIKNGKLTNLKTILMRKPCDIKEQNKTIKKEAVCIVCDYRFAEKKLKWSKKIKAICHPFKSTNLFPDNVKLYLLSESDFCDEMITPTGDIDNPPTYDFVCFTLLSRQGVRCKGIHLLPLIDQASKELGIRGLIIDYSVSAAAKYKSQIYAETIKMAKKNWLKYTNLETRRKVYENKEVCKIMLSSKFVLFPNIADASPRMIPEAIVRGRPVVVNSAIYGGWKYVTRNTGRFFIGPTIKESLKKSDFPICVDSIKVAMREAMELDKKSVKEDFYSLYGFKNSCINLAKVINEVTGSNYKAVAFKEWKKHLIKIAKNENWI